MEIRVQNIEEQVKILTTLVGKLEKHVAKVQSELDEHLLEHMIEERNSEFDLMYPEEED
jgi:hypothetical protein